MNLKIKIKNINISFKINNKIYSMIKINKLCVGVNNVLLYYPLYNQNKRNNR